MKREITIIKNEWNDYIIPKKVTANVVGYTGLNENDGIFAVYKEKDMIYFCSGDDGQWRIIFSFHKDWLWKIFCVIRITLNNINK